MFSFYSPHVKRFALTLEVPEEQLMEPLLKCDQVIVVHPLSLFLWPNDVYVRNPGIERLQDAADEFWGMNEGLQKLVNVRELALACDSGVGYLHGFDFNPFLRLKATPVFTTNPQYRHVPENEASIPEPRNRKDTDLALFKMSCDESLEPLGMSEELHKRLRMEKSPYNEHFYSARYERTMTLSKIWTKEDFSGRVFSRGPKRSLSSSIASWPVPSHWLNTSFLRSEQITQGVVIRPLLKPRLFSWSWLLEHLAPCDSG